MKTSAIIAPSVLLIICLIGFPQISETIYSPALPNIASGLATTSALTQWTMSIYFVGFALGVLYWGRLSDRIGRRPVMLLGIVVYGCANLGCLLSPSIEILLLSRLIQAFGASVGSVITLTIAREAFADSSRHKLFSTIGAALSLTPALGPFIGGYVSDWFGWRANFTVLIIMTLLLLVYTWCRLPETKPNHPPQHVPMKIGKACLLLIRDKHVLGCAWIIGAINGILFGYYTEAPFIFIRLLDISPGTYGWLGIFIGSASMLGSMLSRRLGRSFTGKQISKLGCLIMLISNLILCAFVWAGWITPEHIVLSILLIMLPMAGLILGSCSLIIPVIMGTALNQYKEILGTASALFGLAYYVLIAGFTWFMGVIHNETLFPMPFYFLALSISIAATYYYIDQKKPT